MQTFFTRSIACALLGAHYKFLLEVEAIMESGCIFDARLLFARLRYNNSIGKKNCPQFFWLKIWCGMRFYELHVYICPSRLAVGMHVHVYTLMIRRNACLLKSGCPYHSAEEFGVCSVDISPQSLRTRNYLER